VTTVTENMTEARTVKLVRLRDGVDVFGNPVETDGQSQRVGHLVSIDADLDSPEGVRACCGLEFPAGTLVEMPWIERLPHGLCLRRSPWPRRKIEAEYMAANVMPQVSELPADVQEGARAILGVMPEVIASIAAGNRIFGNRAGWTQDVSGVPVWEYAESFNGVLMGEKRFPRNHDLGLFALTAEVVQPGVLRVRSCGVLGGCPTHAVHTEYLSLDNVDVIKKRLADLEVRARLVGLERMSWCLIVGPCSTYPTHEPVPEMGTGPQEATSERERSHAPGEERREGPGDAAEARGGSGERRPPASRERCGSA
jgi:hypothetical protein